MRNKNCSISMKQHQFFTKYLFSTKGSIALNYLRDRGLSIDTIKEFKLGLSPSKSDELINSLVSEGYNEQDIENAGLAYKPENKSLVDRFRNRVMFPISNLNDRIVAFGGRSLNTSIWREIYKFTRDKNIQKRFSSF